MNVLDADDNPLFSKLYEQTMSRDIVQFVPFNEYRDNALLLACEVREEIPK